MHKHLLLFASLCLGTLSCVNGANTSQDPLRCDDHFGPWPGSDPGARADLICDPGYLSAKQNGAFACVNESTCQDERYAYDEIEQPTPVLFIHQMPGVTTSKVDVYVNDRLAADDLAFGEHTPWLHANFIDASSALEIRDAAGQNVLHSQSDFVLNPFHTNHAIVLAGTLDAQPGTPPTSTKLSTHALAHVYPDPGQTLALQLMHVDHTLGSVQASFTRQPTFNDTLAFGESSPVRNFTWSSADPPIELTLTNAAASKTFEIDPSTLTDNVFRGGFVLVSGSPSLSVSILQSDGLEILSIPPKTP